MRRAPLFGAAALVPGLLVVLPTLAQETPRAPQDGKEPACCLDWTGPYLGLAGSAGGSFSRIRLGPTAVGGGVPGAASGFGAAGDGTPFVAGGFVGYNRQLGPFVAGIEAGIASAPLRRGFDADAVPGPNLAGLDPSIDVIRVRRDRLGSVRGRVGTTFDTYLLYATIGVAVSDLRVRSPLLPEGWRPLTDRVGLTYGLGIETAITPNLSFGLDYQRSVFEPRGGLAGGADGLPRGRVTTDDVTARLVFRPGGTGTSPDAGLPRIDATDWSLHGQTTFIQQADPSFRSPYRGPNSFVPGQGRETWTVTGYLGRKLWEGGELYYNPELNQGFGLSRTLGIAGYVNGEAQKAGAPYPKFRSQRYFLRQVFGLGGETEDVPDGLNQIAGTRDVDRITVTIGKFAVGDFFDDNAYAHDPRLNFNNWSLWASSAFDFPANLPGFTQGVVVELNRKDWALRGGAFQVPKDPNSDVLDPRIDRKGGLVVELENRFEIAGQPGKLRLGAFTNVGRSADYRQAVAIAALAADPDPNDAALASRRDRRKSGLYANLEQALTADLGLFARASWNDGRTQTLSFTDVDASVSGGLALKGTGWDRPLDTVGLGVATNWISAAHRAFFAAGGLGLLVGDGQLRAYGAERALETYYRLNVAPAVDLSANYQLVFNPGYNRDRGPASVLGVRLHAEF